jgi:hypothetical protein
MGRHRGLPSGCSCMVGCGRRRRADRRRRMSLFGRQQAREALGESGRRLPRRQARPLHLVEFLRNACVSFRCIIDDDRHDESPFLSHVVCPVGCELPITAEVPFEPRLCAGRNDRYEQRAVVDLLTNLPVPGVSAAQLALVEPDLDAGGSQCLANPLGRSPRVLRREARVPCSHGCAER